MPASRSQSITSTPVPTSRQPHTPADEEAYAEAVRNGREIGARYPQIWDDDAVIRKTLSPEFWAMRGPLLKKSPDIRRTTRTAFLVIPFIFGLLAVGIFGNIQPLDPLVRLSITAINIAVMLIYVVASIRNSRRAEKWVLLLQQAAYSAAWEAIYFRRQRERGGISVSRG